LDEVKKIIDGVIQGAGLIGEAGLQHRDIKPENVIFIEGMPALGDFGLATEDMTQVSMRGTPHHAAPSWYLESGGNSDQWGVAILLYQLLAGNSPDKMGRPKYLKPAEGMILNGEGEKSEWNRLQSLVNRATSEVAGERFQGFEAFRKGLLGGSTAKHARSGRRKVPFMIGGVLLIALAGFLLLKTSWRIPLVAPKVASHRAEASPTATPAGLISVPALLAAHKKLPPPLPTRGKEDDVMHIYSAREINQMNSLIGDKEGMKKLIKANEDRYRRVVKNLPTNATLMDLIKKMRE
jgi:serine/threonine protein kinase